MPEAARPYVPALGFRWLTPLYDAVLAATLNEERLKGRLVAQGAVRPGQRVLDLGCGTGTLAIMLKRACPQATVVGLDGDGDVLAIARRKVAAAGVAVALHQGMAFAPPFAAGTFDRVVSSLLLHHLTPADKRRTLACACALLRPGGELHVADWGAAQNLLMRIAFLGVQLFDGFASTAENVAGRLVPLMEEAGFTGAGETHREMTLFGTLSFYRAVRPGG
jgi:ubiquinone/menaquinone biosynthesis C-methylase UbiE